MPDLLLELRSEEIPARMQRKAAGDLCKMVTDGLVEAGLTYEAAREYWTPRRLTLDVRGLTARSKDVHEERKGPSVKAPEQAVQGFLRSAGLFSVEEAEIQTDPKKGDFYVARTVKPGRGAEEIIAEIVPAVVRSFPWPKSMRWGPASAKPGSLRWVRPLQSILCTFGPETEEPVVVDFEIDGIRSGNVTYGHRFHAPEAITVRRFDDYAAKLEAAKVVIDADRRKEIIATDARNLAFANGMELVEDEGLLEEVSGLVEWPVVLMGEFEEAYLEIPAEVIRLTIRANQKCFVTTRLISPRVGEMSAQPTEGGAVPPTSQSERAKAGRSTLPPSALPGISPTRGEIGQSSLSNRFVVTANIAAKDGGVEIARGNGKVVRARLSDALYFWKTDQSDLPDLGDLEVSAANFGLDLKKPLDQRMARLDHLGVTFHAKLGTQGERVQRIARLAEELAPVVGADPALARRAAVLAKADLTTEVVGEFPELQGQMGRTYAALQGEEPSVAAAIEEHYKPQGPSDTVPTDPVSIAVALADKLDTLVGFWAIDEKPTGSRDPYALRRAALGVIRIVVENGVRLDLSVTIAAFLLRQMLGYMSEVASMISIADTDKNKEEEFVFELASGRSQHVQRRPFELYLLKHDGLQTAAEATYQAEMDEQDVGLAEQEERRVFLSRRWDYYEREVRRRFEWSGHENDFAIVKAWQTPGAFTDEVRQVLRHGKTSEFVIGYPIVAAKALAVDLLSFFHDRLKVYLRDQGARHDLIDAVLASGGHPSSAPSGHLLPQGEKEGRGGAAGAPSPLVGEGGSARSAETGEGYSSNDDLLTIVRRVEALGAFLDTEDGRNLLAGTKRAANILAAEEKKGTAVAEAVDPSLFREPSEKSLYEAVNRAENDAGQAIGKEEFSGAMLALSALREPVDSFFEDVLVNDEDEAVRANRLALLARIRAATGQVADFSKIAG